jgi:hypothetical protein
VGLKTQSTICPHSASATLNSDDTVTLVLTNAVVDSCTGHTTSQGNDIRIVQFHEQR